MSTALLNYLQENPQRPKYPVDGYRRQNKDSLLYEYYSMKVISGTYTVKCERKTHKVLIHPSGSISFLDHGKSGNLLAVFSQGEIKGLDHKGCYAIAGCLLGRASLGDVRNRGSRRSSPMKRWIDAGMTDEFVSEVLHPLVSRRSYRRSNRPYRLDEDYYMQPLFAGRLSQYGNSPNLSTRLTNLVDLNHEQFIKKCTRVVFNHAGKSETKKSSSPLVVAISDFSVV